MAQACTAVPLPTLGFIPYQNKCLIYEAQPHPDNLSLLQCAARNGKEDVSMVALRCPCGEELWWVGDTYEWVYFDDLNTSETHTEQITHCPGCGRQLDRRNLETVGALQDLQ